MNEELLEKIYQEIINIRLDLIKMNVEKFDDSAVDLLDEPRMCEIKDEILEKIEQFRKDVLGIYTQYQDHSSLNDIKSDLDLIKKDINDIYVSINSLNI